MKRAEEFNTDFTIPKKSRSDNEPDLYTQVISDDHYKNYESPRRYGTINRTPLHRSPSNQNASNVSSTSTSTADYNNLFPNSSATTNAQSAPVPNIQYTTKLYVPHPQYLPMNSAYDLLGLPKEVPKLGNTVRNSMSHLTDPTLPKVLTSQFQPLFCKLCDFQLSSNAMAKLHYDSKKHNKKVRQFLIDYAEETGEPLHPKATLLASQKNYQDKDPKNYHCTVCDLPLTGRLHAESHYMGKNHRRAVAGNSPAGRDHFDSTGKWVREVALRQAGPSQRDNFGLDFLSTPTATPAVAPTLPMKKDLNVEDLRCELCDVAVTSDEQMALHISGQKHRKRLNQIVTGQLIPPLPGAAAVLTSPNDYYANFDLSGYRTPTGSYYCEPCKATVNSEIPFRQHLSSKKHKRVMSSIRKPRPTSNPPPATVSKPGEKTVTCDVCNVSVTSEMQLQIHVAGQRHQKLCEEKGLEDNLPGNSVVSNGPENQQYFKYRTPSGLYYCKRCDLTLNTEAQFKSHITGKKHWSKIQGTAASTAAK